MFFEERSSSLIKLTNPHYAASKLFDYNEYEALNVNHYLTLIEVIFFGHDSFGNSLSFTPEGRDYQ